MSMEQRNRS